MGNGVKLLFLFIWVCSLYTVGILVFTKGFLLKRVVIPNKSQCINNSLSKNIWKINSTKEDIEEKDIVKRSCSLPHTFSKAVLLVIDALRFDFAQYNESLQGNDTLPYQNKLIVLHELMTKSPQNGRLYKFIADPPTTTMQRLKGLTTGSLPTFVDAGSNFASYEITEDNFVTKLKEHGKSITFMGDDTWEGLFPQTFNKSFPFPSFNVKDLHTVDNGVIQHLVPELKLRDWDVLIAHFLGVDHCGHKYGPNHPAMADKLNQMNQVISSVLGELDNDTVLFILGDHGMTRSGDHGGDSKDELDAALFVYSPISLVGDSNTSQNTVSQMDLVPTISLLLGLPIPFGNLGTIITDLVTHQQHITQALGVLNLGEVKQPVADNLICGLRRIEALQLNAFQVQTYLNKYVTVSGEIPQAKLEELSKDLESANLMINDVHKLLSSHSHIKYESVDTLVDKLSSIEKKYLLYLAEVKKLCQTLWAKFDLTSISIGLFIIFFSMFVNVLLLRFSTEFEVEINSILKTVCLFLAMGGLLSFVGFVFLLLEPLSAVAITFLFSYFGFMCKAVRIVEFKDKFKNFTFQSSCFEEVASISIFILYGISEFSNSFVVSEDGVVFFLVNSLAAMTLFCAVRKCKASIVTKIFSRNSSTLKKVKKDSMKLGIYAFLGSDSTKLFVAFLAFVSFGRLAVVFKTCREEQWSCKQSIFHRQLAALGTEDIHSTNQRLLISLFSVFTIPIALRQFLSYQGNLNGSSLVTLFVKYGLIMASFLMLLHWILQLVPPKMAVIIPNLQLWHQILLPQVVYWVCLLTIVSLVWNPLLILLVLRDNNKSITETVDNYRGTANMDLKVIQLVFKEMKKKFEESYSGNKTVAERQIMNSPLVYGLGTVYSSAFCVLSVSLILPLSMILGEGLAGSVFCLFIQLVILLEIRGLQCDIWSKKDGMNYEGPNWSIVILYVMLGTQYFYFTGHQATIPAIRFEAAFVGLPGDLDNLVLPGLLIFLNTFASQAIFAVALPLLFFWPIIPRRLLNWKSTRAGTGNDVTNKGEFVLNEHSWLLRTKMWRMFLMYLLVVAFKVFATACSAALHRRHLMVWKIFAPRFVFEGASFLFSIPMLVLVYLFFLRVNNSLTKWTQKLQTNFQENQEHS